MPEPSPEQVLAQVRYAVAYQWARFPKTEPQVAEAADKLVRSEAFADFVGDMLAPEAAFHEIDGERPAKAGGAEVVDLMAALKASLAATGPKKGGSNA